MNQYRIKRLCAAVIALIVVASPVWVQSVQAKTVPKKDQVQSITRCYPIYSTTTIAKGKTMYLKAEVGPESAVNQDLKWTTSNKKILTITQTGRMKGIKTGKATIKATTTDGSKKSVSWKVTVGVPVTGIECSTEQLNMEAGDTAVVNAKVQPEKASNQNLVYNMENTAVAEVSETGTVIAKAAGTTSLMINSQDGRFSKTIPVIVAVKNRDLIITSNDVRGNTVMVVGQNYDNIIIDSSIGNAQIMVMNTKVSGSITMPDGQLYKLELSNCQVGSVEVVPDKAMKASKIFMGTQITPVLLNKDSSSIGSMRISGNVEIQRQGASTIGKISVDAQKSGGSLLLNLVGIQSDLDVVGTGSTVSIDYTNCQIENATIQSGMAVTLSDGVGTEGSATASSLIKNLYLYGIGSNIVVDVAATNVQLDSSSMNNTVVVTRPIGKFVNSGSNTNLTIKQLISTLSCAGSNAYIRTDGSGNCTAVNVDGMYNSFDFTSTGTIPKIYISSYVTGTMFNNVMYPGGTILPKA